MDVDAVEADDDADADEAEAEAEAKIEEEIKSTSEDSVGCWFGVSKSCRKYGERSASSAREANSTRNEMRPAYTGQDMEAEEADDEVDEDAVICETYNELCMVSSGMMKAMVSGV